MIKKRYMMLITTAVALAVVFAVIVGYWRGISGTVVDAKTGEPIEGAVVFVEWTKTKGIGLTYTETYRIVEKATDKKGKFRVFGVLSPFVNPPTFVIYKKGYVAWRNDYIFPDYKKRADFKWKNDHVFKLEHFRRSYSHSRHILFLRGGLNLGSSALGRSYSWEGPLARKEEVLLRKKRKTKKPSTYTEKEIWKEIVEELYSQKEEGKNE